MSPSLTRFLGKTVLGIFLFAFSVSASHILPSPALPSSFLSPPCRRPIPHARVLCGDKRLEKSTYWNTRREIFDIITGVLNTQETAESLLQNACLRNEQDPIVLFLHGTEFVGENSSTDFPPENAHGKGEIIFLPSMPKDLNNPGEKTCSWGLPWQHLTSWNKCVHRPEWVCVHSRWRLCTNQSMHRPAVLHRPECVHRRMKAQRKPRLHREEYI